MDVLRGETLDYFRCDVCGKVWAIHRKDVVAPSIPIVRFPERRPNRL